MTENWQLPNPAWHAKTYLIFDARHQIGQQVADSPSEALRLARDTYPQARMAVLKQNEKEQA